jgi:glycosyltransferase involved in cell wall biosynthesis
MRILTITPSLSIGGIERAAQNFSIGYKKRGHDVVVLNHGRDGVRRRNLEAAGCKVYTIDKLADGGLEKLNLGGFDVVHIHREGRKNQRENDVLSWARRSAKIIAETNVFFAIDYSVGSSMIDIHFQLAEINFLHWQRRGGKNLSTVVPNPVDADEFPLRSFEDVKKFRGFHKIPGDAFIFGRIGQPIPGKWDPIIVRAFDKLAAMNSNVYLLLVGPSDDSRREVERLPIYARQRILMLDTIDDPSRLGICYQSMDCFLHAARQGESFGYVLTEALLYGVPVITLSRPHRDNAQTEVIRHNLDGFVVRSRKGMLEAMKQIMKDEPLRENVRLFGRKGVVERFGMDAICAKSLSIFDRLLASQSTEIAIPKLRLNNRYEVEGIGQSSRIELLLARFYDFPPINFYREMFLTMRRKARQYLA